MIDLVIYDSHRMQRNYLNEFIYHSLLKYTQESFALDKKIVRSLLFDFFYFFFRIIEIENF